VGTQSKSPKFASQIERIIEKGQLRNAVAIAGEATKLLRDGTETTIPSFRIAESLAAFDGLACGLGLAFINAERVVQGGSPVARLAEPEDWSTIVSQEKWAKYSPILRVYLNGIAKKERIGTAALPLPAYLEMIEDLVDATRSASAKAYCLVRFLETPETQMAFPGMVLKLQDAIESEKIEVYDEIRRAVNEAFRLLVAIKPDD
jgi:hypothetical protein